ncbi:MAG: purine-nucleoside phosphorylase, partial [Coriobacteriaceae bacterium]|nr:purine-nucleoside phosphorylase [Coriobacteriaceae bacterium]
INEAYEVGDFCIISDHINFTGRNPIVGVGSTQDFDRFFSMTAAYDPHYREVAHAIALQEKVQVHEGVYVGVLGPSFETPAEIKAFRSWGADVVGMSTVEEVIAARHMKMRVLGISLIANMAAGIGGASPDGEEVLDVARRQQDGFSRFLKGILPKL